MPDSVGVKKVTGLRGLCRKTAGMERETSKTISFPPVEMAACLGVNHLLAIHFAVPARLCVAVMPRRGHQPGELGMDIRVLGPLVVTHRSRSATPSARKQRQVLSLLLLSEGEVLSKSAIISEIWDHRPPKSMHTTIQTYVMQIRKRLSTALGTPVSEISRSVLVTRNGGYMLMLRDATVDLYEYRSLERDGMSAFAARDDDKAVLFFDRALALWRGGVLADVEHGRVLEPAVAGLEQSRLTIEECRIEAELRRGRHRESLSELATLTAQHSYNENLRALYMLALYRSGCRGRALEAYHQLRGLMIDQLGIEPSTRLRRLHHALLTGVPTLDEPRTEWPATARRDEELAVPRQ